MTAKDATSPRSVGPATHSTRSPFFWARIKLTSYYTAGVFLVLMLFSALVYHLFIQNLRFDEDERGYVFVQEGSRPPHDSAELSSQTVEAREGLVSVLLTIDGFSLIFIVILSYVLAYLTLRPLEEAYMRQKRFISDAAHELRTPLAVMKAGAEVVQGSSGGGTEQKEFIAEVLREVGHMSQMTDDMLFLARNGEAKGRAPEHIDMRALVVETVKGMESYAREGKVQVHTPTTADAQVVGFASDLRRLLKNLIRNAIDYNVDNGSVDVTLSTKGNRALLTVADTGVGIAPEHLPKIFDRFYKVDESRQQRGRGQGTGLGLSIVKEIADAHHGTISVDSTPGKGTTVTVTFPLA